MQRTVNIFSSCFIISNSNTVTIKAILDYEGLEKFGYYLIYLLIYFFPLSLIWYAPLKSSIAMLVLKGCLLVLVFLIVNHKVKRLLSKAIIRVNKKDKTLVADLDDYTLKVSDIKKIEIIEEEFPRTLAYRLNFHLSDGVKSSLFAFTNYNDAKKIVDTIKSEFLQVKTT